MERILFVFSDSYAFAPAQVERAHRPRARLFRNAPGPDFCESGTFRLAVCSICPASRISSMPRYFFDIDNREHYVDEEGTELAGTDDARIQAVIFAGDYLRENPGLVRDGGRLDIAVRDHLGTILLNVAVTTSVPADRTP
jgi:hypothetical protein